jgi:hypothetical protein
LSDLRAPDKAPHYAGLSSVSPDAQSRSSAADVTDHPEVQAPGSSLALKVCCYHLRCVPAKSELLALEAKKIGGAGAR